MAPPAAFRAALRAGAPALVKLHRRATSSVLYLLGTYHGSPESAAAVDFLLERVRPDVTAVELDARNLEHYQRRPRGEHCESELVLASVHPRRGRAVPVDVDTAEFYRSVLASSSLEQLAEGMLLEEWSDCFDALYGFTHPGYYGSWHDAVFLKQRDQHMAAALAGLLERKGGRAVAVVGKAHVPGVLLHLLASQSATHSESGCRRDATCAAAGTDLGRRRAVLRAFRPSPNSSAPLDPSTCERTHTFFSQYRAALSLHPLLGAAVAAATRLVNAAEVAQRLLVACDRGERGELAAMRLCVDVVRPCLGREGLRDSSLLAHGAAGFECWRRWREIEAALETLVDEQAVCEMSRRRALLSSIAASRERSGVAVTDLQSIDELVVDGDRHLHRAVASPRGEARRGLGSPVQDEEVLARAESCG